MRGLVRGLGRGDLSEGDINGRLEPCHSPSANLARFGQTAIRHHAKDGRARKAEALHHFRQTNETIIDCNMLIHCGFSPWGVKRRGTTERPH